MKGVELKNSVNLKFRLKMSNLVVKVLLWRVISIIATLMIMLAYLGDIKTATGLSVFLHFVLTILNYGFEVAWEKFSGDKD